MPCDTAGLGSSPFARRYWGNRCYFLLLAVLRCFSSHRSPPALRDAGIAPGGLPHSDIRGSLGICPSPRLFAACHVLLRLREPRHPPCALPTPLCPLGIRDSPPELRGALRASGIQCLPWFARCVVFRTAGASAPPPSRSSFRFQHVNVLPSWRLPDKPRSSGRLCVSFGGE